MEMRTVLRVIVTDHDIRKVTLPSKPQTLDSLIEQLGHITYMSQADTDIISVTSQEESPLTRQDPRPETFEIPSFSVDVEYRLCQGNLLFMRDKTYLKVPRDMKHEVLEKLAEAMYKFKAYPCEVDFNDVAPALVKKHPCLFEPGSSTGWNGWKNSINIKFKMGNYRSKLRRAGCTDVLVNSMKRGSQDSPRNVKKPKRFEINFLPNMPSGESESSMESNRLEIVEEMKKRHPSSRLIAQYSTWTQPFR
ncbi:sterile alpha motif domain-containing protein 3-like isoform X1 [Tachysurus ichikawai]